jgi:uncharacterized protein (DUF983 family)
MEQPTMLRCPKCGEEGISIWGKYRSGLWSPTTCKFCGARVTNRTSTAMIVYGLQFLVGMYFAVQVIITTTAASIIIFVVVWLSFDVARILFAPLVEVSTKSKIGNPPLSENDQKWGRK